MLQLLFKPRLAMLAALSCAMLTACAHAGPPAANADPVIETREITRLICPPDLRRPLPDAPAPAADAVIRHNEAGGVYLDAKIARGDAAEAIVRDSLKACDQAGAK